MDVDHMYHHYQDQGFDYAPSSHPAFDSTSSPAPTHLRQWPRAHAEAVADRRQGWRPAPNPRIMHYPLQSNPNESYDSESTSPGDGVPAMSDPFRRVSASAMISSHPSDGLSNSKRAYRQRRKDPSCDACRERKVKCDATETTSCSECSSRNVGCQFTKETNRRMSSIKQFQDLERQLRQAHQQLDHYKSIASKASLVVDPDGLPHPGPGLPAAKQRKAILEGDFSQVRQNLKDYGHGLLQMPSLYCGSSPQNTKSSEMPDLPPRQFAERLLVAFHENFHAQYPILHWPTFQTECDRLYRAGSLAALGGAWGTVFLCVLACGTLPGLDTSTRQEGRALLNAAISTINLRQDDYTIQEARMAFLTSYFLVESNLRTAGRIWLGLAVHISQEIGLHTESKSWPSIEGEVRRRLWYSIYSCDRILALEFGKPLLINDADCNTSYPEGAEDHHTTDQGFQHRVPSTPLLATVNIVQSFGSLIQLFKSHSVPRDALKAHENYFDSCLSVLPKIFHPSAREPMDPRTIMPLIWLQNARLLLHRHNLSPASKRPCRVYAMDRCVGVARETSSILSRCLKTTSGSDDAFKEQSLILASSASSTLCTHIWRCLLFLLFRGEYPWAIVLVRAASVIGEARQVNGICGRHIEFFLRTIYSRLRKGHNGNFDDEEEMIAYASGDLQNSPDGGWIWQEGEDATESNRLAQSLGTVSIFDHGDPGLGNVVNQADRDVGDWCGWDMIEERVQYLCDLSPASRQTTPTSPEPQTQPSSVSDTSRMNIANII